MAWLRENAGLLALAVIYTAGVFVLGARHGAELGARAVMGLAQQRRQAQPAARPPIAGAVAPFAGPSPSQQPQTIKTYRGGELVAVTTVAQPEARQ